MNKIDIQHWKEKVGEKVRLPSTTSFTENFREAIYSARHKNKDKDIRSVVFVLTIFNQDSYPGFRLNNEKYTAYPDEEEYLLPAGLQVEVEDYKKQVMGDKYVPKVGQIEVTDANFHIFYLVKFG